MPPINEYKCNRCGFSLPSGWGGYLYVQIDREVISISCSSISEELKKIEEKIRKLERLYNDMIKKYGDLRVAIYSLNEKYVNELLSLLGDNIEWIESSLKMNKVTTWEESHLPMKKAEKIEHMLKEYCDDILGYIKNILLTLREELTILERRKSELKEDLEFFKNFEKELTKSGKEYVRIHCPHPGEFDYAEKILQYLPSSLRKEKMGFNSYCICLDCLHQFEADLRDEKVNEYRFWYGFPTFKEGMRETPKMKDERKCPMCGSTNVKTVLELVGNTCPKCKEGKIIEIETGIIS